MLSRTLSSKTISGLNFVRLKMMDMSFSAEARCLAGHQVRDVSSISGGIVTRRSTTWYRIRRAKKAAQMPTRTRARKGRWSLKSCEADLASRTQPCVRMRSTFSSTRCLSRSSCCTRAFACSTCRSKCGGMSLSKPASCRRGVSWVQNHSSVVKLRAWLTAPFTIASILLALLSRKSLTAWLLLLNVCRMLFTSRTLASTVRTSRSSATRCFSWFTESPPSCPSKL
mmetsp:Transcript_61056/g.157448  ORF Transcript_61056/g.157448 Transcript_61056/m.157448 type:complete len:226 (+) Transcript_61056:406-1083(+)